RDAGTAGIPERLRHRDQDVANGHRVDRGHPVHRFDAGAVDIDRRLGEGLRIVAVAVVIGDRAAEHLPKDEAGEDAGDVAFVRRDVVEDRGDTGRRHGYPCPTLTSRAVLASVAVCVAGELASLPHENVVEMSRQFAGWITDAASSVLISSHHASFGSTRGSGTTESVTRVGMPVFCCSICRARTLAVSEIVSLESTISLGNGPMLGTDHGSSWSAESTMKPIFVALSASGFEDLSRMRLANAVLSGSIAIES